MRGWIAFTMILSGSFLLICARQVSRDSSRTPGSLMGNVTPGAVRIAGAGALILGLIWVFYWRGS